MRSKFFISVLLTMSVAAANAQVDLINKVAANQNDSARTGFGFTTEINLATTPVENQASSGTCWSYSTNSFLESEMIRNGGKPLHLSKMFSARCIYMEKAINYVRMHGAVSWGDGGEAHDVLNMYAKYGAIPEDLYKGLDYGTSSNEFGEMQAVLKAMLDAIISAKNDSLTTAWPEAFASVLDSYLGKVPEHFKYQGKEYSPKTFAQQVVRLNPDDYAEFVSMTTAPYYKKTMMLVPDNWTFQYDYNIPMENLTDIIDNALHHGYTVAWGADVSEPYFSWKNGIAYVPDIVIKKRDMEAISRIFEKPLPEITVTPELRQHEFDNYNTQDDHGMHIVGLAKDKNGKEYYIVKNSWGESNDNKGFLYVSKTYVQYKTTSILVNKNSIPADIRSKMDL